MSDIDTYDARVQAIQAYNQPTLYGFLIWLKQSGLSEETIYNHVTNIEFFTKYLVYYEPLQKLDEAKSGDVWMFLVDWYPRKTLCASARSVKSYSASFKKFFKWMANRGCLPYLLFVSSALGASDQFFDVTVCTIEATMSN